MINKLCIEHNLLHPQKIKTSISKPGNIQNTGCNIQNYKVQFSILAKIMFKSGFSLVEMLMALLVASLLLAALAPVMTKRLSGENINISGTGNSLIPKDECSYIIDDTASSILIPDNFCQIPNNVYSIGILMASGGGGGGGAAESNSGDLIEVKQSTASDSLSQGTRTNEIYTFDSSVKNMQIAISGGGGGAGGSVYAATGYEEPTKPEDCKTNTGEFFGAYIASSDNGNNGGICVSLFNPGERRTGSPDIPSDVNICTAQSSSCSSNTNCTNTNISNCCWTGQTAASGCATVYDTNQDYNSCNRTVCQWNAAKAICSNWKPLGEGGPAGRLPLQKELEAWAPKVKYNSTISKKTGILNRKNSGYPGTSADGTYPGLQLCDTSTSNPSSYCNIINYCYGASSNMSSDRKNYCYPEHIWSGTTDPNNANRIHDVYLSGGSLSTTWNGPNMAFGVRCVISKTAAFYTYSGGGASSGAYALIDIPVNILAEATKNGIATVRMQAGSGGEAGENSKINGGPATNGKDGTSSIVSIISADNELLWSVEIPGGIAGSAATISGTTGNGGLKGETTSKLCKRFNKLSIDEEEAKGMKEIECSSLSQTVNIGSNGTNGGFNTYSTGGKNANLPTSSNISAGGGSIPCNKTENNKEECPVSKNGIRMQGYGGSIRISTATTYPGAGGGGGSAGTLLHFSHISVSPEDRVYVQIGHGGNGGVKGQPGLDGGDTTVIITDKEDKEKTRYVAYGGKGGNAGISGNVSTLTPPKGGPKGLKPKTPSIGKGINSFKYTVYPSNLDTTEGEDGNTPSDLTTTMSQGGNGGINNKISQNVPVDSQSNQQGQPCGGLSTSSIKVNNDINWSCGKIDTDGNLVYDPYSLSRALGRFTDTMLATFPGGSTGGGGGGWRFKEGAGGGAKGLGGYVYIYYGEWGEEK